MIKFKKVAAIAAVALMFSATTVSAFAAPKTPAEIVSSVTGKSIDEVLALRQQGKTYGTIAAELNKLDEFKALSLESKEAILSERVADGSLTQAAADSIMNSIKLAQESCTGDGSVRIGMNAGAKFGSRGQGMGNGGASRGQGIGRNAGAGLGYNR